MAGETPETLLGRIAKAQADEPALDICGVHFFTFGSLAKSVEWAGILELRRGRPGGVGTPKSCAARSFMHYLARRPRTKSKAARGDVSVVAKEEPPSAI